MLELQASTDLNMGTAFFMQKRFEKSIEKCNLSLALKKSIKAYYRRGKAYGALEMFEEAAQDMKAAVMLDTSDPNDIQQEFMIYQGRAKAKDK